MLTMLECLALILLQVINGTWSTASGGFLPFSHSARPRPLSRSKQSRELIICQNWAPSPTSYRGSERVLSDHVRVWIKSLLLLVWQLTHKHTRARAPLPPVVPCIVSAYLNMHNESCESSSTTKSCWSVESKIRMTFCCYLNKLSNFFGIHLKNEGSTRS